VVGEVERAAAVAGKLEIGRLLSDRQSCHRLASSLSYEAMGGI